jgi:putative ABC transport system permease protein
MPDLPPAPSAVEGPRTHDFRALVRARIGEVPVGPMRESDIVDELAQHVADDYADLVAAGVADSEAIAKALAPLDQPARIAAEIARAEGPRRRSLSADAGAGEAGRTAFGAKALGTLARDVRYAVRLLARAPDFAAAAIVTLALGIGANAAIFSVVRAVVLRPPPYRDPSRVVVFLNSTTAAAGAITSSSLPDYEDWQRQLTSFDSVGLLSGWTFNVTGLDLPERVFGARVSGSLFPTLGTPPLLGRVIEPDDDRPDRDEVLVLGYRVWQRLFAGDKAVVGKAVMLEGRPHVIVGVMPPRFRFPTDDTEMWAAIRDNMTGMPRNSRFMVAAGRLKPGVTVSAAQAELDALTAQLRAAYPETNKGWRVRLAGVHDAVVGDTKSALIVLAGAVGLVLLIACANVANLLLARATSRRRETAIRFALGASRGRIAAQWLTENMILALAGGIAGVALAYGAVRLIVGFGPAGVPRLDETAVDLPVLAFAFLVAMLAGALPALAPAVRMLRRASHAALTSGVAACSPIDRSIAGAGLIVCEVALAMTLAVAGALLFKSFARLTAVKPGFDADSVLSLKVFLTPPRYRTVASGKQYMRTGLERLSAMPGVESAAAISQLPLGDPSSTQRVDIEGRAVAPADRPSAAYRTVSANYFRTLRIPMIRGRMLTDDDRQDSPLVVVVNDAAARAFWPDQDPIGRRFKWATGMKPYDDEWHTVVGVVADVKSSGLDQPEAPAIYAPYTQRMFTWLRWNTFVVRTHGEPQFYAHAVREELTKIDPLQPVYHVASLDTVIGESVAARRFHTGLVDVFAVLALALAAVGVYGTIGCWVAERTREIGVRMALGAPRARILLMVIARAGGFTAIGVVLGIALSLATGRALSTLLFSVEPYDLPMIGGVALLVLATGIAAAWIPARRAASLDPLEVIRT